jgi:hypothetical protein
VRLLLAGFTLSGGSHGLLVSGAPGNLGPAGLLAWSSFRDLRFVEQQVAGVQAEGIFGIDANFWYRVDFIRAPVAIRGFGTGSAAGMTYADKQHFLDCQFSHLDDAAWFWTADRPCGGHVWTDCLFRSIDTVSKTRSANNLLWSNCLFEDVTGGTAIQTLDDQRTSTYYFYQFGCVWRGRGPQAVTSSLAGDMGTLFVDTEFAQIAGSIVPTSGRQAFSAWGSRITGRAVEGAVQNGVFVNASLVRDGRLLETLETSGRHVWLNEPATPAAPTLGC